MGQRSHFDAVIVGSGPNGLAAAATLVDARRSVLLIEGSDTIGGGARSAALTLLGFMHDVCSSVFPLAAGSPFLASLPLERYGLTWLHPEIPLAHALGPHAAVALSRSIDETVHGLGADAGAYTSLMTPLVRDWSNLARDVLAPPLRFPQSPLLLARFGRYAVRSARGLAERQFREPPARALFGGIAAHAMAPLERPLTASVGLLLGSAAHAVGWPFARGGAQSIANALSAYLVERGAVVETETMVGSFRDLPPARAYLFDTSPPALARIAGDALPAQYRRRLRCFRPGPAAFKIDFALAGPIPWTADVCRRAGTLHLGGSLDEIGQSARLVAGGQTADRPFMLVGQPSLVDRSVAPPGRHTAWAYCHVPKGSTADMIDRMESQIERCAPGFRERVLARSVLRPHDLEAHNRNLEGGDILGGAAEALQLLFRPMLAKAPYRTPIPGVYLCSASTPPGPGVHGMSGYWAARAALGRELR